MTNRQIALVCAFVYYAFVVMTGDSTQEAWLSRVFNLAESIENWMDKNEH